MVDLVVAVVVDACFVLVVRFVVVRVAVFSPVSVLASSPLLGAIWLADAALRGRRSTGAS